MRGNPECSWTALSETGPCNGPACLGTSRSPRGTQQQRVAGECSPLVGTRPQSAARPGRRATTAVGPEEDRDGFDRHWAQHPGQWPRPRRQQGRTLFGEGAAASNATRPAAERSRPLSPEQRQAPQPKPQQAAPTGTAPNVNAGNNKETRIARARCHRTRGLNEGIQSVSTGKLTVSGGKRPAPANQNCNIRTP